MLHDVAVDMHALYLSICPIADVASEAEAADIKSAWPHVFGSNKFKYCTSEIWDRLLGFRVFQLKKKHTQYIDSCPLKNQASPEFGRLIILAALKT